MHEQLRVKYVITEHRPFCSGAHKRYRDGVEYKVSQIFKHEGFSMSHLRNDITVLKLSSKVQLTSTVGTVCLPAKGSRAKIGAHCWTSGTYTFSNELGQMFFGCMIVLKAFYSVILCIQSNYCLI